MSLSKAPIINSFDAENNMGYSGFARASITETCGINDDKVNFSNVWKTVEFQFYWRGVVRKFFIQ